MWHHKLWLLWMFSYLRIGKVKLCTYSHRSLFSPCGCVLEGISRMTVLSGPKNGRSGRLTPFDDMKTDVGHKTVLICCEEERRTTFPEKEHFLSTAFSFPQNLCLSSQPVSTNNNLSVAMMAPKLKKDEINNICHCEWDSKLRETGNIRHWRSQCSILFLLFFPSSYPCKQSPLCWSRRVVTDASSQPGRREEMSNNFMQMLPGGLAPPN